MIYDFKRIEQKWQDYWDKHSIFKAKEDPSFPKDKRAFILDMFPYPSAQGLHVGHPEGYTATDIVGRYLRMKGFNVLHTMGYDSFGLPAEQYAIKTGVHPRISTEENIANFNRQIRQLGFAYDWDRSICTHDSSYFHWTQYIFLLLYKKGLAYEAMSFVNWCEETRTVLANEEVFDGKCVRTGHFVVKKQMRQWILRITEYADRLLEDLDLCDWPDSIKTLQKNWIGRSEGLEIFFDLPLYSKTIKVFTTRPDTLFGVTYLVLAPEHDLVDLITTEEYRNKIVAYREEISSKDDMQRTDLNKEKTGIFTGAYARHPITEEEIPIWIADYVLLSYGTGSVMAVPAHDERDFEFAQKYNLPIKKVLESEKGGEDLPYIGQGISINSMDLSGLETKKMKSELSKILCKNKKGKVSVQYKLRDWVFSRQRFWGEPIPLIHCECCGIVPLEEKNLPLELPEIQSYQQAANGKSPLAMIEDWMNVPCPSCGKAAKRETNTMPQWAGSCWYYLRYIDPHNSKFLVAADKEQYWMPVDLYVGGQEHAVLHLLYARFWHKFLFDCGIVSTKEPFLKLVNQGMVLGENHEKMSKSRGNVVNPDDIVREYGADSLRLYEMFMGPLEINKPWNMNGLKGIKKFLDRVWRLYLEVPITEDPVDKELLHLTHKTIKKVRRGIESISQFNTAISAMMIFVNFLTKKNSSPRESLNILVRLLTPFAPHICEELWEILGYKNPISFAMFPEYLEELTQEEEIEFVIQINGKNRDKIILPKGLSKEELEQKGMEKISSKINGQKIIKCIIIPDKLMNLVVQQC